MQRIMNVLATLLAVFGAVNWGLMGLAGVNLVNSLLGKSTGLRRLVYLMVGVAGLWLGIMFALPKIFIALSIKRSRSSLTGMGNSPVGRMMPTISGTTLGGDRVTIPEDTHGKVALLVMGFAYEARFDVEDWAQSFMERFGHEPDVVCYEMPMIGGIYRLFAPMIDAGMRRGTPTEMYDNVVTVYGPQDKLREKLGAMPTSDTWVYLLDRDGTVLFEHGGVFDEQRFKALVALAASAIAKGRAEELEAA